MCHINIENMAAAAWSSLSYHLIWGKNTIIWSTVAIYWTLQLYLSLEPIGDDKQESLRLEDLEEVEMLLQPGRQDYRR